MPRRISPEIDMQIFADASTGMLNKDIAKKYGVSASYVSKILLGNKTPNIYVPKPDKVIDEEVTAFESDINAIAEMIGRHKVIEDPKEVEAFVTSQVQRNIIRAKICLEILKKLRGN